MKSVFTSINPLNNDPRVMAIVQKMYTKAHNGSDIASTRLFKICEPDILVIGKKYAKNESQADEICQDARVYLVNVINDKNTFINNFQYYMRKIVSCIGKNYQKQESLRANRFISLDSCAMIDLPSGITQLRTIEPTLRDKTASNPRDVFYIKEVIENLEKLPPLQKKILETDIGIGESKVVRKNTNELAEYLNITPDYVAKSRERGRKKLAQLVDYKL